MRRRAARAVEARSSLRSQLWSIEGRKEQQARRPKTSVRFVDSKHEARSIERAQAFLDGHQKTQKDALRTGVVVSSALEFAAAAGEASEQAPHPQLLRRVRPAPAAPRAPPALIAEPEPDADLFQNTVGGNPSKFHSGRE